MNVTMLFASHFTVLHCTMNVHVSSRGSSRCKGVVVHTQNLLIETQRQFRPSLVVAYGETTTFAAK